MPKQLEPFCFWCGGNPRYEFSTEPRPFHDDKQTLCESCAMLRQDGILCFEMSESDPRCGNPTMANGKVYYTGRWVVIDDATARAILPTDAVPEVLRGRITGITVDRFEKAGFSKYPWRTLQ